ncbi:hypothetical protein VPH35_016843 [Triticum aestivum]
MSTSLVRSSVGGRSVVVPLIRCPSCRTRVKFYLSNTEKHEGWVFYRCPVGDHFWHWELEYVAYLVDNQFLVGNEAVDALGAAEDKREELIRARNRRYAGGGAGVGAVDLPGFEDGHHGRVACQMSNQQAEALVGLGNEILVMMKALLAALIVVAVLVAISVLKK